MDFDDYMFDDVPRKKKSQCEEVWLQSDEYMDARDQEFYMEMLELILKRGLK